MITPSNKGTKNLNIQLYNFLLEETRHHLVLHNFNETETLNVEDIDHTKFFCLSSDCQKKSINIRQILPKKPFHDVYLLKTLDSLFYEVFKLEHYVLNINFFISSNDWQKWTNEIISFHHLMEVLSINCIIKSIQADDQQQSGSMTFEFSSRDLADHKPFCIGERCASNTKQDSSSLNAELNLNQLIVLIEKNANKLAFPQAPALHIIIPTTEDQIPLSFLLACELCAHEKASDIFFEKASTESLMQKANKIGAKYLLLIGPEEQQQGTVLIKNMINGELQAIKQAEAIIFLGG